MLTQYSIAHVGAGLAGASAGAGLLRGARPGAALAAGLSSEAGRTAAQRALHRLAFPGRTPCLNRCAQVNLRDGEQRKEDFLAISPAGKIPAIGEEAAPAGGRWLWGLVQEGWVARWALRLLHRRCSLPAVRKCCEELSRQPSAPCERLNPLLRAVDTDAGGLKVFESGAILCYLAGGLFGVAMQWGLQGTLLLLGAERPAAFA